MCVLDLSTNESVSCASDEECLNNGSCVSALNASSMTSSSRHHYCRCHPRWTGDRCQTHLAGDDDLPVQYTPVQAAAESDDASSNASCSAETCIHGVCAAAEQQSSASRCFCIPGQSVSRQHTSGRILSGCFQAELL